MFFFYRDVLHRSTRRGRRENNRLYFSLLYLQVATIDALICYTAFPVALCYLRDRHPGMFGNRVFCVIWGFLWEIIPYISVYQMAVMAVSRARTITLPLKLLSIKTMAVSFFCYLILCCASKIVPQILLYDVRSTYPYASFHFNKDSLYCFLYPMGDYWFISSVQSSLQLGLPAPVIILSCVICLCVLEKLRRRCKKLSYNQGSSGRQPATTIIILSAVYVTCNIPVFLNYVLYSFTWLAGNKYTSMYSNTFLYWYSWSLTFVVSVGVNSACNPLVLFWRLTTFRDWVKGRFRMMVELSQRFKALGLSGAG
ncbi:hypothetical protein ACHWQZ_G011442 [Mnemiopsis leidyi]